MYFFFPTFVLATGFAFLAACSKTPAEPDAPRAAAVSLPTVAPLHWDAPGGWTKLETPGHGPKKATYRVDKVGNDKEGAEMNIFFFGTGSKGDPGPLFQEWQAQFEGTPHATHAQFEVKGFKVETMEVTGTYQIALTPPARGMKKPPVQMVKNGWRLHGAVVRTPDRGNWFFKLTGPEETVQSATSAFRAMLETLR